MKEKKQDDKDLSGVEYYIYHKKHYYTNKCPNKKPQN